MLKIEDNVDDNDQLSLMSDNDDLMNEDYENPNRIIRNISDNLSAIQVTSNIYDESIINNYDRPKSSSLRPKSAFKQSFDYDEIVKKEKSKLDDDEKKKKRSKSKDKSRTDSGRSSSSRRGKRSPSPSSSRMATGDTGYSSASSSLTSLRLKSLDGYSPSSISQHQPIIVSSNPPSSAGSSSLSSSTTNSLLQNTLQTHNIKPLNSSINNHAGLTSLKQLKSNLAPLPGIKLPK